MKSTLYLVTLSALLSCQSAPPKPAAATLNVTPIPPPSTPASVASTLAPTSAPFEDPLPRWRDFLTERFGKPPGPALIADFNGDGALEVATQIGSSLFIFTDVTAKEPEAWEVLDAAAPATLKDAAWAIEKLPALKGIISEKQSVLVVGVGDAPLLNFWHPSEGCFAWLQVVPPSLEATRREAEKTLGPSFGLSKNNLYGPKGFDGEEELRQGFVGDFDADGTQEIVVLEAKGDTLSTYKIGAKPTTQKISYAGPKAALYQNLKPTTIDVPFDSDDVKAGPFTIKGDYIEIWMPEKSGVFMAQSKGKWKTLWVSD